MYLRLIKIFMLIVTALAVAVILSACGKEEGALQQDTTCEPLEVSTTEAYTQEGSTQSVSYSSQMPDYDVYIILENERSTVNGVGATFENNILSITKGGTYYITGSLSDGQIYVNSIDEDKKVKIILDSVNISCSFDAPLFVENSPKETLLYLRDGTVSNLSDTAREIPSDTTEYATSVIYSKDDLQIEGGGVLNITGNFAKGIFSKNDIDIRGGSISISATDDGIRGKDSVEIENASITIVSGGDGIRTSEETEADKGDIIINSGTLKITSGLDGIQATGRVEINGGNIGVLSGGGATGNFDSRSEGMGGRWGGSFMSYSYRETPDSSFGEGDTSSSTKGIKADKSLTVNNGGFYLDCLDDALHSPTVTINAGTFSMESDDDGIHADEALTINGGSITVKNSYEGIEGRTIIINGGEIIAKSADDGFNAATSDSSSQQETQNVQSADVTFTFMGGMGGFGGMDYDGSCSITMTGGYVLLLAEGDGIDSNGNVTQTGGTMIVYGPTMGANGALDYGGSYHISGGTLLATGVLGMAQSATGDGVKVLNFNLNGSEDTVYAIADENNSCKLAFIAPKNFQNVVFASDSLVQGGSYSVYSGGAVTGYSEKKNGMCFDGIYAPGNLLATLS